MCGYWLNEARVFLRKTNRKCRNTCYLRDTLFRDTPRVTWREYGERIRPSSAHFWVKQIDRAREHALASLMALILISQRALRI